MKLKKIYMIENGLLIFHGGEITLALTKKAFGKPVIRNPEPFKGEKLFCTTFTGKEWADITRLAIAHKISKELGGDD